VSDDFGGDLVVDASVAAKWYLKEEGHERAAAIMEAGLRRETKLLAPVLLAAELGNVLWQRNRRGDLIRDEVFEVWAAFVSAPVNLFDIAPLMSPALEISLDTGCAVYDALYVALAEAEGAKLVTADRKLVRTLEATPFASSVAEL